jgi:hypothetical protein
MSVGFSQRYVNNSYPPVNLDHLPVDKYDPRYLADEDNYVTDEAAEALL